MQQTPACDNKVGAEVIKCVWTICVVAGTIYYVAFALDVALDEIIFAFH